MRYVEFIETDFFSKQRERLLSEDEYTEFQKLLVTDLKLGSVIVGTGGCRKTR
ncbi:hypothetical protein BrE312_0312 [Brenneria sp. EniD312]|nr:hypothetical protein BrE312_0312 [Brenneria sp. EniD312]